MIQRSPEFNMANQCLACAYEVPEGATVCAQCGATVEMPAPVSVAEVPAAQKPMPTPAEVQAALARVNEPAYRVDDSLTGIGGWLILVAINLAFAPLSCCYGIFIDLRALYGAPYENLMDTHHGLAALVLFEASTNTLFLLAVIALNILFYTRKKIFPKLMIAYLAVHLVLVGADHLGAVSLHLNSHSFTLVRTLIYTVIWIPYFMNSIRVEQTFTK
jgi:hypothetical protein